MFVRMLKSLAVNPAPRRKGQVYHVEDDTAAEWIRRGIAIETDEMPDYIREVVDRLSDGAGKECVFEPFCGEFGWEVMFHVRFVHLHRAARKIVCCRPGHEVLYPSASKFITDWQDPIDDAVRAGTIREGTIDWPELRKRFPNAHFVKAGGLTPSQELYELGEGVMIPFTPRKVRGNLAVDVLLGVRNRKFCPVKNWPHWPKVARGITAAGYTFAVVGSAVTSYAIPGQKYLTPDTDAAVEAMQTSRVYVGSDTGSAHLASVVGCPMLVFREHAHNYRDFLPRMQRTNPGNVEIIDNGWDDPEAVIGRILAFLRGEPLLHDRSEFATAQHGEDRWMAQHWHDLGLPERGVFVEVGAADGIECSNTLWLERVKGWTGLLIEPDPRSYPLAVKSRPDCHVCNVAIANSTDHHAKFALAEPPTLSGLQRKTDDTCTVLVEPLSDTLASHGIDHVDVLSIDTEGTELDVWASLDLNRWRPRLVIVEWRTIGLPDRRREIKARFAADGYRVAAELGGNLLFLDNRLFLDGGILP